METSKETEQKAVARRLAEWGTRIDVLKARVRLAGDNAGVELHQQIREVTSFERSARQRLAELTASDGGTWKHLKAGIAAKWRQLRVAAAHSGSK